MANADPIGCRKHKLAMPQAAIAGRAGRVNVFMLDKNSAENTVPGSSAPGKEALLLTAIVVKIEEVYVPTELRKQLDLQKVEAVAEKIMDEADERPIQVRRGKGRYVLVKGVHRLEARKALGEETIQASLVRARQH